jgi:uncharacterized membrane protein YphA (DoxX/SURF4 family)
MHALASGLPQPAAAPHAWVLALPVLALLLFAAERRWPLRAPVAELLGRLLLNLVLAGGALLVAGVRTRIVALALTPFVLGATWAHSGNGWVFTAQHGGWEYPAFLTLVSVVVALLGNGARDEIGAGRAAPRYQTA